VAEGREDVDIEEPFGGERAWPTAVCLDGGRLVTGSDAEQRGRVHPECYRAEFKLELGRPHAADLGGRPYTVTELVTAVLSDLRSAAEEAAAGPVSRAVLTVPASYGPRDKRRDLMIEAATQAGFGTVELLPEPVAAALASAPAAPTSSAARRSTTAAAAVTSTARWPTSLSRPAVTSWPRCPDRSGASSSSVTTPTS
jgi:molecular chaperone DnaK (HSP70)